MKMRPGALLGERYRLDDRVATGGVGEIWKAVDERTGRWVAVKVLRDRHVADAGFRERFRAEAQHTAELAHPGLAEVFDYVEDGPLAYLVMEYLTGRPLSALLRGGRELGSRLTLGIVGQVAVTLQAAHDAGVVHRDVKPDNLIVGHDGRVKVTDFGIARGVDMATLTQPGVVVGTAVYMSPEQAEAQRVTAASDIYSLGVVCYECLAGRAPFLGSTPVEIAYGHVREVPPPLAPYVPRALRELVAQCLAKDPAQRPGSMAEVAEVAYAIAQTLTPARPPAATSASASVPHTAAGGKHRADSRRRGRVQPAGCPAVGKAGADRAAGGRDAGVARRGIAVPAVALAHPLRRRRAVMASLAGTTVLASGIVLGAQIGVIPAMAPYRGAEASSSPEPTATAPGSGDVVPGPSLSTLHSETPPAHRSSVRDDGSTASPTPSDTATPGPTSWSAQRGRPAPSRSVTGAPEPTSSPGDPPSPTPTGGSTPRPPSPPDDPGSGEPSRSEGSPETTTSGASSPDTSSPDESSPGTLSLPPATPSPEDTDQVSPSSSGSRSPEQDTEASPGSRTKGESGTASPTDGVGLRLGPVDVELPDQ